MSDNNQMNTDNQMYDLLVKTITKASQNPIVIVKREDFLRKEFKGSDYLEQIISDGPQSVFTTKALRKRADKIINKATNKTSFVSFVTGIPSNPVIAVAAGGGDIAQYFGFALNLSQQIAYLFGEDELFNGDIENLPEEARIRIIAYLGVMFGASGSALLISNVSKVAGKNIGMRVTQKALTKTAWYPLVKKIGATLGYKITKQSVGKTVTKTVPIFGGIVSGGLTYLTFKPMGGRLADVFVDIANGDIVDDYDEINELNDQFKESCNDIIDIV